MNIKSLLIGSAAALAAVSGAHAADAIVAAEPEPMEYVKVCDAFGKGYFYIPGTETCLQISGYVRFQGNYTSDGVKYFDDKGNLVDTDDGYRTFTRGYVSFDTKTDTELGTLTGHIDIEGDSAGDRKDAVDFAGGAIIAPHKRSGFVLDGAYIELGGFKAGYFYNFWDKGINGETDDLGSNLLNAVSYTYTGGAFSASLALETFNNSSGDYGWSHPGDDWGVSGLVTGSFGAVTTDFLASYDFDAKETSLRSIVSADIGPGTLQVAGIWGSGATRYWADAKWSVAASYKAKISEKFSITPGVQYWNDLAFGTGLDQWKGGVTLDYNIVSGLDTKVSVQYVDPEAVDSHWEGFVRLQRTF